MLKNFLVKFLFLICFFAFSMPKAFAQAQWVRVFTNDNAVFYVDNSSIKQYKEFLLYNVKIEKYSGETKVATVVSHPKNNLAGMYKSVDYDEYSYTSDINPNCISKTNPEEIKQNSMIYKLQNHSYNYWKNLLSGEQNFGPYMRELQRRIKMNWVPPKGNESKRAVVLFRITKDGELASSPELKIIRSSGDQDVDNAAINAVNLTAPFSPLPSFFKGNYVDIQFTFDYNVFGATDIQTNQNINGSELNNNQSSEKYYRVFVGHYGSYEQANVAKVILADNGYAGAMIKTDKNSNGYTIQVGVFADETNANVISRCLMEKNFPARVENEYSEE